jgi:hypothetical protein
LGEAKIFGTLEWGPNYCFEHPVTNPLHKPEKFALILDTMGYSLYARNGANIPDEPLIAQDI